MRMMVAVVGDLGAESAMTGAPRAGVLNVRALGAGTWRPLARMPTTLTSYCKQAGRQTGAGWACCRGTPVGKGMWQEEAGSGITCFLLLRMQAIRVKAGRCCAYNSL